MTPFIHHSGAQLEMLLIGAVIVIGMVVALITIVCDLSSHDPPRRRDFDDHQAP